MLKIQANHSPNIGLEHLVLQIKLLNIIQQYSILGYSLPRDPLAFIFLEIFTPFFWCYIIINFADFSVLIAGNFKHF